MLKVGLTGGIGSGKSTVAKIFALLGVPVYYADLEARKLINRDPVIRQNIIQQFGSESYNVDGLNRLYISSIVFNDDEKLQQLNSLTHPATILHADEWMMEQVFPYTIKEAALLFESKAASHLDFIIGVSSPLELRINRIIQRDTITREHVLQRMSKQMNEEEKLQQCDALVVNDERSMIIPQIVALHERLLETAGSKT